MVATSTYEATKLQPYPYSLRTVAYGQASNAESLSAACGYRLFLYMVPPKDALTIENLYTHFVFQFDAAIASGNRVIESVGIVDQVPTLATGTANYQRRITINQSADANRRVDLAIDLSSLLKRENVVYRDSILGSDPATGYTMVEVLFPSAIGTASPTGIVELWKIDALFTTTGIR